MLCFFLGTSLKNPEPHMLGNALGEVFHGGLLAQAWTKSFCCGDFGSLRRCSSQRVGSGSLFSIGFY